MFLQNISVFFAQDLALVGEKRSFIGVGKTIQFSQVIKTQLLVSNYCI